MRSLTEALCSIIVVSLALPHILASDRCAYIPPTLWCSSNTLAKECGFEEHCNRYKKTVHNQRINMTILGEALCIDTMNFFEDQLYPVIFKHFNNFLNIDYVPYGNVKIVNGSMVCQHGFMECFINRYQSCMIDVLEKQDEYLPLFSCLEYKLKRRIPFNYALWGCYDAHPLPMGTKRLIEECFNTELGDQLQEEAGRVTNSVWPDVKKSVPWLVFNGVSLRVLQEKFKIIPKLLCEWYQGDKKIPYCAENANIMSSCINTV